MKNLPEHDWRLAIRATVMAVTVCVAAAVYGAAETVLLTRAVAGLPSSPPAPVVVQPRNVTSSRIVVNVEYDHAFLEQHGPSTRDFINESLTKHNIEWLRFRDDIFVLGELSLHDSGIEEDASHLLAEFMLRTAASPGTVNVRLTGRPLKVYSDGIGAQQIGGLAYRRSDAVVISSTPGVTTDLLAYHLFHELGHCWDAYDLPFKGGESTFGEGTSFEVDAGNVEILTASKGPQPRATPNLAPRLIELKLRRARSATADDETYKRLADLMLHEPSPSNHSYVRKKRQLLTEVDAPDRRRIEAVVRTYEITPRHQRADAALMERIAEHYWEADRAIRAGDDDRAAAAIEKMHALHEQNPHLHLLVGAVERKLRRAAGRK